MIKAPGPARQGGQRFDRAAPTSSLGSSHATPQATRAQDLHRRVGNQALQRLLGERGVAEAPPVSRVAAPVIQRVVTITNIDFDPARVDDEFRDGIIRQQVFTDLRAELNKSPFEGGHRNLRVPVLDAVARQDFSYPDIPRATDAIVEAIRHEYQNRGNPINARPMIDALSNAVRDKLVANIEPGGIRMDDSEIEAFDQVARAAGAQLSRAKGAPSQVDYANLPEVIRGNVAARLDEIRAERAKWYAGKIGFEYTLPGNRFSREIVARQRRLHYQGNHTNDAGWLPAVALPVDQVTQAANAIYNAATRGFKRTLDSPNAMALLEGGDRDADYRRRRYRALRQPHIGGLTDDDVKNSAMAALCQGVSAYIEFNMPGGMSRLVYDARNGHVYITAHYKWRQGYNPFFRVNNCPVV